MCVLSFIPTDALGHLFFPQNFTRITKAPGEQGRVSGRGGQERCPDERPCADIEAGWRAQCGDGRWGGLEEQRDLGEEGGGPAVLPLWVSHPLEMSSAFSVCGVSWPWLCPRNKQPPCLRD